LEGFPWPELLAIYDIQAVFALGATSVCRIQVYVMALALGGPRLRFAVETPDVYVFLRGCLQMISPRLTS
jgi:hypothetical protein